MLKPSKFLVLSMACVLSILPECCAYGVPAEEPDIETAKAFYTLSADYQRQITDEDFARATITLKQILSENLRYVITTYGAGLSSGNQALKSVESSLLALSRSSNLGKRKYAISSCQQIISALSLAYGQDDLLVARFRLCLARCYRACEDYTHSQQEYEQYIKISRLYQSEAMALIPIKEEYFEVCQKSKKQGTAAISTLNPRAGATLEKVDDEEADDKRSFEYLRRAYEEARQTRPYWLDTQKLLNALVQKCYKEKRNEERAKYQADLLTARLHSGWFAEKDSSKEYVHVILDFVAVKDFISAEDWLNKLESAAIVLPDPLSRRYYLDFKRRFANYKLDTKPMQYLIKLYQTKPENQFDRLDIQCMRQLEEVCAQGGRKDLTEKMRVRGDDIAEQVWARDPYGAGTPYGVNPQLALRRTESPVRQKFKQLIARQNEDDPQQLLLDMSAFNNGGAELDGRTRDKLSLDMLDYAITLAKARRLNNARLMVNTALAAYGGEKPFVVQTRALDFVDVISDFPAKDNVWSALDYLQLSMMNAKEEKESAQEKQQIMKRVEYYKKDDHSNEYKPVVLATKEQVLSLGTPSSAYEFSRLFTAWKVARVDNSAILVAAKEAQPVLLQKSMVDWQTVEHGTDKMSPFKPCPPVSASAVALVVQPGVTRLYPGDYKVSHLATNNLQIAAPGKVRIFITGHKLSQGDAFTLEDGGSANIDGQGKLELWYDGYGTISLHNRSSFTGKIYAPMGRVEIDAPDGCVFKGAIVARDVVIKGKPVMQYEGPE